MSGNIAFDALGDREPDYWVTDLDPKTGIFEKVAEVLNTDMGRRVGHPLWKNTCLISGVQYCLLLHVFPCE